MLSKNAFKKLVKQCLAEVIVESDPPHEKWTDTYGKKMPGEFTVENQNGKSKFITTYAVGGLEQIPDSIHNSKEEALKAARDFIQSYNTPKSIKSGEKFIKIENGYALQHIGGGTVAIATVYRKDNLQEAKENNLTNLSNSERNQIGLAFKKVGLDGNGRFEKKEKGLLAVTNALSSLGFQLDMVSADMIMGDKGSRMFTFRRINSPGADVFTENPEIQNSRIVFVWEALDRPSAQYPNASHIFEILAYAS